MPYSTILHSKINLSAPLGVSPSIWIFWREMKHLLLTTIAAVVLVGCGNPDGALIQAAKDGNIEAVKQHLAAGANVNAKDGGGWTLLLQAVAGGHKEIVELLIDNGADANGKDNLGWTPLFYAAFSGRTEVAELLIAEGVDVNAKDNLGTLRYAASGGHKEIVELLIANGADVYAKGGGNGTTPLDVAIKLNHTELTDLLRKHGGKTAEELK